MKNPPYSLSEAQHICKQYKHLEGQQYGPGGGIIDNVVIAPFDHASKKRFIIYYLLFNDADMALTHEYKGLLYDVIVISGAGNEHQLAYEDVATWLNKTNADSLCSRQAANVKEGAALSRI